MSDEEESGRESSGLARSPLSELPRAVLSSVARLSERLHAVRGRDATERLCAAGRSGRVGYPEMRCSAKRVYKLKVVESRERTVVRVSLEESVDWGAVLNAHVPAALIFGGTAGETGPKPPTSPVVRQGRRYKGRLASLHCGL